MGKGAQFGMGKGAQIGVEKGPSLSQRPTVKLDLGSSSLFSRDTSNFDYQDVLKCVYEVIFQMIFQEQVKN